MKKDYTGDGRRPEGGRRDGDRRPYPGNRAQGPARRTYGGDFRAEERGESRRSRETRRDEAPRGAGQSGAPRGRRAPYEGSAPRVGRVARDVPRAQRVDGDDAPRARRVTGDFQPNPARREDFEDRNTRYQRGADLHRGGAYRSPSGPGPRQRREEPEYEPPEIPEDLAAEFTDVPMDEHLLAGRNPIREALKAGRPMEKLLVAAGDLSGSGREILRMAREAGVVVQTVERSRLDQIYPAHQGMLAYVAAVPYVPLEDILASARERGEEPFLILLDGITDPHNLGAIIRSAECAGAHGVVVPERRAAGLSPAAAKAAAGALNHMPIARVKNLNRAIETLKAENIWVIGTAMDGEDALSADLSGPIALVIGSEGEGVSRLTLEKCDRTISLPMKGRIESLNASVAAGILMYEVVRARTGR